MKKLNLALNEAETKALLLMIHAASEIHWTSETTREHMLKTAKHIQTAVSTQWPHLANFLADKNAPIGDF